MPTLTWLTRETDLKLSQNAPYRLLEAVPELSYGDAKSENMLIQGDNLDALKALLPYYAGKVKCIYIDPPVLNYKFSATDINCGDRESPIVLQPTCVGATLPYHRSVLDQLSGPHEFCQQQPA